MLVFFLIHIKINKIFALDPLRYYCVPVLLSLSRRWEAGGFLSDPRGWKPLRDPKEAGDRRAVDRGAGAHQEGARCGLPGPPSLPGLIRSRPDLCLIRGEGGAAALSSSHSQFKPLHLNNVPPSLCPAEPAALRPQRSLSVPFYLPRCLVTPTSCLKNRLWFRLLIGPRLAHGVSCLKEVPSVTWPRSY